MSQSVRIIGGVYRGKKLSFPSIDGLRPTPDRIKETLFNWLMHDIRNARCLDAFAGSGALGFEALSRGAKEVVMIETSPLAFKNIQRIALSFNSAQLTIHSTDALWHLQTVQKPYDIIFLDPPFKENYLTQCLQILETKPCITAGGLLYIESPIEVSLDNNLWLERKSKKAGLVFYALFEKR